MSEREGPQRERGARRAGRPALAPAALSEERALSGGSAGTPVRHALGRIGFYTFVAVVTAFFALPMLWLAAAPFDATPGLTPSIPDFTVRNFRALRDNPYALASLRNSILLALGTAALALLCGALAAYSLSRVRIPGRDVLLYLLLLLSSIVTGTAAMVPIFLLMFQLDLIDSRAGVVLVLTGGLLPAAIFILKDFMDSMPRSYEESARVFGASPLQILRDVVVPVTRPGLATIAVWAVVNVWGNFLIPFILLLDPDKQPAAVVMRTFYTEGGQPNLALISAFSLVFSIPVVVMYLFVNRRYGFRFHGGIKA
jgi:multiple sugar transport system permease protein